MKYIGNQPEIDLIDPARARFDRIEPTDPTSSVNPPTLHAAWLNRLTGKTFICIDNTTDVNVWV